jgi:response regulator RpfG family c-di-GMP phosphodiesterase
MRNKLTDWSVVILIASVQLALMLIAVMALFSWVLECAEDSVYEQVCDDNRVISRQVAHDIVKEANSGPARIGWKKILSSTGMPNGGFLSLIDSKSGKVIQTCKQRADLSDANLGQMLIDRNRLLDSFGSSNEIKGRVKIEGVQHFVVAKRLPAEMILIVGQQRNQSMGTLSGKISLARRVFFIMTLVLGFMAICLSIATLNRLSARVKDENEQLEKEVINGQEELVQTQSAVIFGLAKLAESRDNDTGEHLDRIRNYVTILTNELATRIDTIDEQFIHHLALASSLHDIGKVGIPDAILLKPGRLTVEEREIMQMHAAIGGRCLEAIQARLKDTQFMELAKQVAFYHHERWDGEGYPHQLAGEEIPLVARIVAVADVYDALTSKRPYKDPMSHLESKAIILGGSGTQFDPEVVDAFLRHEEAFEAISRVQIDLSDADVRSEFQDLCERVGPLAVEI